MTTLNQNKLKKKKKERMIFFACMSSVLLLLLPWFSYILHQFFSLTASGNYDLSGIDYNYISAVRILIQEKRVRSVALGVLLLYGALYFYLTLSIKQTISKVDEVQITDDIKIPVAAGNGQYGSERFLTEPEKKKKYKAYEMEKGRELEPPEEKPGIPIDFEETNKKQTYRYMLGDMHSVILAITGGGKTRRVMMQLIALQALYGLSIVCSDVKGELFYFTAPFVRKQGYDVLDFDLRNPNAGVRYNFLQPILNALRKGDEAKAIDYTWDLVSVLVGEPKGDPIWTNGESASIASSILAVAMEAPEECRNMTNVYYFIAYMCKPGEYGQLPLESYLKVLPYDHPCRAVFAMAELSPHKTRSSFFAMALGTLRLFTNPNIASMTCCSDFDLKDISRKKTALYMIIPDEKKTYYPIVSLLITQAYIFQVELANENGLRLPVDTDYNLDEVGNFPTIPILPEMITAGRSRGVRVNLVIQDYQQMESKYKDAEKTILGNCEIEVVLKVNEINTQKRISEKFDNYTVEVGSASASVSDGLHNNASYGTSSSLTGRRLLTAAEVGRIKPPYVLVKKTGEYAAVNILPDISKTVFNDVYGMGDEEFNRQLIRQREAERVKRTPEKVPLWGIWESYSQEETDETQEPENVKENQRKRISFLD